MVYYKRGKQRGGNFGGKKPQRGINKMVDFWVNYLVLVVGVENERHNP
jgi:hypothetical protein